MQCVDGYVVLRRVYRVCFLSTVSISLLLVYVMLCTVDDAFIRPVVANSLARPVAPVTALNATCACEIPAMCAESMWKWCGRFSLRCRVGAEARDEEGRGVRRSLALEYHDS